MLSISIITLVLLLGSKRHSVAMERFLRSHVGLLRSLWNFTDTTICITEVGKKNFLLLLWDVIQKFFLLIVIIYKSNSNVEIRASVLSTSSNSVRFNRAIITVITTTEHDDTFVSVEAQGLAWRRRRACANSRVLELLSLLLLLWI